MPVYKIPSVDMLQLPNKYFLSSQAHGSSLECVVLLSSLRSWGATSVVGRTRPIREINTHTHYRVMFSPSTISILAQLTRSASNRTH
jgi:hypothetical protein